MARETYAELSTSFRRDEPNIPSGTRSVDVCGCHSGLARRSSFEGIRNNDRDDGKREVDGMTTTRKPSAQCRHLCDVVPARTMVVELWEINEAIYCYYLSGE